MEEFWKLSILVRLWYIQTQGSNNFDSSSKSLFYLKGKRSRQKWIFVFWKSKPSKSLELGIQKWLFRLKRGFFFSLGSGQGSSQLYFSYGIGLWSW